MEHLVSWSGLGLTLLFVLCTIVLVALWYWPRNSDGTMMSAEELDELLSKMPSSGATSDKMMYALIVIALLAIALTRHSEKNTLDIDR
jgi:hypothetical protein